MVNDFMNEDDDAPRQAAGDQAISSTTKWHKHTSKVYNLLKKHLDENDPTKNRVVTFDGMTRGAVSRRTAAGVFFELLQLKTWDFIELEQDEPYSNIKVRLVVVECEFLLSFRLYSPSACSCRSHPAPSLTKAPKPNKRRRAWSITLLNTLTLTASCAFVIDTVGVAWPDWSGPDRTGPKLACAALVRMRQGLFVYTHCLHITSSLLELDFLCVPTVPVW